MAVLALVAVMGIGLSLAGPTWQAAAQREREREWLRVGTAYANALARYHQASPGSVKQFPKDLAELLMDTRFVGLRRHLRELYTDPLRPGQAWLPVLGAQQRVIGVRSAAQGSPFMRQPPTASGLQRSGSGERYQDWIFTLAPALAATQNSLRQP